MVLIILQEVSDFMSPNTDINAEITSEDNPRFVIHDSHGFEPGESTNYEQVRNFIQARNRMLDIKDRLHAIWLCFAAPVTGGLVSDKSIEDLLELKKKGGLGEVPIIVVITLVEVAMPNFQPPKLASGEWQNTGCRRHTKIGIQVSSFPILPMPNFMSSRHNQHRRVANFCRRRRNLASGG
ncbi:hypothetical protein M408DRAFT_135600 [Serendipita vermifera MAFF 305830]|uniref:Uncharacterized protein n=1 Tax=Serendipita vermifera MAFF 305830 TaxID=933852 RepID=A0A0C3AK98_SERVB|nr:hypothetical protein M408DRAFT_135600 [Serendipita vermifera MAFF 305830]